MGKQLLLKIKRKDLNRLLKMPKYNNKNIYFRDIILNMINNNQLDFLINNLKLSKRSYYSFLTSLDIFCFFLQNKFDLNELDIEKYLLNILCDNNYDMQIFYNYRYFYNNYSGARFTKIFNKIILNKFQIVLVSLSKEYLIKFYIPNVKNDSLYNFKYFRNESVNDFLKKSFTNNAINDLDDKEIFLTLKQFLDLLKIQGLNNLYLFKTVNKINNLIDLDYAEFWSNILKQASINKEIFTYRSRFK